MFLQEWLVCSQQALSGLLLTLKRYPYPMMDQFSATQRVVIFVASAGLLTASSSGLQWVHGKIHDPTGKKLRVE